jgi:anthranilate phosphoribosyltransferase
VKAGFRISLDPSLNDEFCGPGFGVRARSLSHQRQSKEKPQATMDTKVLSPGGGTGPAWFAEVLEALMARRDLTAPQMKQAMEEIVAGRCAEAELAAFLIALRMKGESAEEVAAAARVLRTHMIRLETGRDNVLDTSGTGGDGAHTFNISTAAALVVAAAGQPVVKHGNRAVSGRCGSADVLAALGVAIEADAATARRCLDRAGIAFCFAPRFHPALAHVAALRRRLRVRTLFNCLGPLVNPAEAPYQLLGVGKPELLDLLAGALAILGVRRALVVCSRDGLDEVSLLAPTQVREVRGSQIAAFEWKPADFGLAPGSGEELRADGPEQSAAIIRRVLAGEEGPPLHMVLANAAAALLAAGRAATLAEGVAQAAEAVRSGRARDVLQRLVVCSQEFA